MSGSSFVIDIGGRQLLIGGDWHLADNPGEAKAVRTENERDAVSFELKHERASSIALYTLPPKLALRPDVVSGGALVALAAAEVFVCQPIDTTRCWVFAAIHGRPLPGFDVVVRSSEVQLLLADARMSGATLTLVGEVAGESCLPLQSLLADLEPSAWAAAQIKKQTKWLRPAGAAAILSALTVAGFVAHTLLVPKDEPAPVQAGRSPNARPAVSPQAVPASAATLPEQPAVPQGPQRFAVVPSIKVLLATVRDIPTSVNGWVASSVTCKLSEATCEITWLASPGANPSGAVAIPGTVVGQIGPANKVVTSQISAPFSAEGPVRPLNAAGLLAVYSADTNFRAAPGAFTITVSAPDRITPTGSDAPARVQAVGPVWAWQLMSQGLQRDGISAESLSLTQLDGNEPQIRMTAVVYGSQTAAVPQAASSLPAMKVGALPADAPQ